LSVFDKTKLDSPESPDSSPPPDAPGAAEADSSATGPPDVTVFSEQLARLDAEKSDLRNSLIRLQADFDNFRKRVARERQEDGIRHTAQVVESLLPVLDSFERAFAENTARDTAPALRGFELIYRQLLDMLARLGVERIEAQGQHFDARVHQAAERVETNEVPEGTVLAELRAGYRLRDRVLRFSMVRVAVAPAEAPASDLPVN
jgi:molecular chaperone GrpE